MNAVDALQCACGAAYDAAAHAARARQHLEAHERATGANHTSAIAALYHASALATNVAQQTGLELMRVLENEHRRATKGTT